MQGGHFKVNAFSVAGSFRRQVGKAGLHTVDQGGSFAGLAGQRADHRNGGIHPIDIRRLADHHADARGLQLVHLILSLGHSVHQQYLRFQCDNLFQVGFGSGLHRWHALHRFGIVAVFATAHQRIPRAQRVQNFAVRRGQRHHARRWRVQRNAAPGHVVYRNPVSFRQSAAGRQDGQQHEREQYR